MANTDTHCSQAPWIARSGMPNQATVSPAFNLSGEDAGHRARCDERHQGSQSRRRGATFRTPPR
jgi:hypothetical protein